MKTLQFQARLARAEAFHVREVPGPMKKDVLVVDGDSAQCRRTCALVEKRHYAATALHSIEELQGFLEKKEWLAVIMDIDTVEVDNRTIRRLALAFPGTRFLCLSAGRFHPELKDAICYHIYACINKPVDPDELFYWLKSIFEDEAGSGDPPES